MTDTLRADVLAFLRKEHVADISAMAELEAMTGWGTFTEEDEAIKTFRAREALIAKLEAVPVPQPCTEKAAARYEWLRTHWKGIVTHTYCSPSGRQVDLIEVVETLGQDLDPQSLDRAIDAAMKKAPDV